MSIDLAPARAVIEAQTMSDECVITRDVGATRDDVLNPTTGQVSRPVGDSSTVYSGKCRVSVDTRGRDTAVEGGAPTSIGLYRAAIPVDAVGVKPGDRLVVTASLRDPQLVDRVFRVTEVIAKTFAVQRSLRLEERQRIGDRP